MKIIKLTLLLLMLAGCWTFSQAANVSSATIPATIDPPAEAWRNLKLGEIVNMSPHSFSLLTGKKMNLTERIAFRLVKMKMKKTLKKNPEMKAGDFFAAQKKMKTWLLVVLIILGALLLAFIIFGLAYSGAI
jgi:hypothetical protein